MNKILWTSCLQKVIERLKGNREMPVKERQELRKLQVRQCKGGKLRFSSQSPLPASGHSFFPGQKWGPEWLPVFSGLDHATFYRQGLPFLVYLFHFLF